MGLTNHCCQMNAPTGNSHISESFTQAFLSPPSPPTLMASVWDTNDNDNEKDKDKEEDKDKDKDKDNITLVIMILLTLSFVHL